MSIKIDSKFLILLLSIVLLSGALFLVLSSDSQEYDNNVETVSDEDFYKRASEARAEYVSESNNLAKEYYQSKTYEEVRRIYDSNTDEFSSFFFTEDIAKAASGLNDAGRYADALDLIDETLKAHQGEEIHYDLYRQRYVAVSEGGTKDVPEVRKQTVEKLIELGAAEEKEDITDEFFFGVNDDE